METQVDVHKVELHNLEDKVLAFIGKNTSGAAPMDQHQVLAVPTRVQRQAHTGGRTNNPDLNNNWHESQW